MNDAGGQLQIEEKKAEPLDTLAELEGVLNAAYGGHQAIEQDKEEEPVDMGYQNFDEGQTDKEDLSQHPYYLAAPDTFTKSANCVLG